MSQTTDQVRQFHARAVTREPIISLSGWEPLAPPSDLNEPMAGRTAFSIGNQTFRSDSNLSQLRGAANSVAALAHVLRDRRLGRFEVQEFVDQPSYEILPRIEGALGDATRKDLLLIYYTGHGVLAPQR